MLFNSPIYFILLLITYFFINFSKYKKSTLLISSIIFFAFAGNKDFIIFYLTLLINLLLLIFNISRKFKLILAIVINISILILFKYFIFIAGFFTELDSNNLLFIGLPVGISFYIFQLTAFHIDKYKKKFTYSNDYSVFIIFISFFPQLIAGPIMRAGKLIPQIKKLLIKNKIKKKILIYGLLIIFMGLFKKVILADNLSIIVDNIFSDIPKDFIIAWVGAFLFSFQIYFDFSGYSDIAIGSAYILGLRLIKNFDTPYFSVTPSEFWRKWHISLSTWIRDYLYIPLGGSKKNLFVSFYILLFTMMLAGLWHGANLTFVLWGFCWAIYIYIFRFIKVSKNKFIFLFWFLNFIMIMILWVIFRSDNLYYASQYILIMFNFENLNNIIFLYFNNIKNIFLYIFIVLFLFSFHYLEKHFDKIHYLFKLRKKNNLFYNTILISLIFIISILPNDNSNPFIYFKF